MIYRADLPRLARQTRLLMMDATISFDELKLQTVAGFFLYERAAS